MKRPQARVRYERKLVELLRRHGFVATRFPGSKSNQYFGDILAVKCPFVYFIEVKSRRDCSSIDFSNLQTLERLLSVEQRLKLDEVRKRTQTSSEVHVLAIYCLDEREWHFIDLLQMREIELM